MAVPTEAGSQLDKNSTKRLPPSLNIAKAKEATDAAYANTIQLEDDESGNSGEEDSEQEVQVADLRSLRSSRSSSSSESSSVDDIEQDLARLDQLRQNVKHNLKLRPIRSTSTLRNEIVSAQSPISPTPSSTTSAYFTPLDEQPPGGNRFLAAPASSPPLIMAHPPKTPFSPFTPGLASTPHTPYTPPVYTSTLHTPRPISAGELAIILSSSTSFPLLIDTRPLATHNLFHIRHSVPIAIPSLILKRSRKPNLKGSQFTTMRSLKQFITTEHGRKIFEAFLEDGTAMGTENGLWNGDVIIYDEDMDVKDRGNSSSTPWALLGVVQSLLDSNANSANPKASSVDTRTILDSFPSEPEPQIGKADYIEGGIGHTRYHPNPQLQMLIVGAGEDGENELGTVSVTQDLSTASNPNLKASSLFASASALAPPRSESPVPLGPSAKRKGPPPSLGLGGGLFQLDTHQAMYKTRGEVLIDQSLNSASTLASANASANSLKTVDSDMTVTQMSLNSTASLSSISDSPSEEQHVLSSVDLKSVNPSPLPMMPSFTISSTVVPSSTAPQHLLPPTHLHLALSEPNPASATLSSGISDSGFKTAFTSLADPSPSPPPSASQIGFSLGKADASATVGGGFKRPPPPSQMNKRPSAPDLRIGIGKEGTSTSIPPNPVVFPNPVPGAGATPPVKRLPKLSLNTGGVGGLGVGGERGTWGTGVGGSLGRRMGTKLRSATVGGGTGSWNRDSHFQQPPLPLSFNLNQNSKISAEPDSTSVAVANAFSPTSNIKNPFQSLTLPLPSSSNPSHSSDSNLPGFGLHPPSPSHLNLAHSHHHRHTPSPPGSARLYGSFTSEGVVEGNVNAPPRPPPSPGFGKTSFGFGEGTTDGREWPGRKLSAPAISLSRSFSTRGPGLPSRDLAPLVPPKRVPSPSWTVSSEAEHDLDTESESETTSTESRTSISSLSTSSSSLESFSEIDEGPGTVNGGSKSDEMVEFPAYQLRVDHSIPNNAHPHIYAHARSESVSSVDSTDSSGSSGPKTAYFTPPHTPTQAEVPSTSASQHRPSKNHSQSTHQEPSGSQNIHNTHSAFFKYEDQSLLGTDVGVHGTSHPPNLSLNLHSSQKRDDDRYDRDPDHPPTPRTARPEEELSAGLGSLGFPKAPDGSGPLLPPHLSEFGFYGQDYHDNYNHEDPQRFSYSAYPASATRTHGGFGVQSQSHNPTDGGYPHHSYADRERSSSFSSLYPPPSTDSVDSESDRDADDPMSFVVSTILPGFLFLGPEPTSWEHVRELRELGVRRIVNLAAECGPDDWGLRLDRAGTGEAEKEKGKEETDSAGFEKYYKIPMRDTVEEDGIGRGVRVVCELLDHARLHSAPAYVHCKAGKSRSVTAVIAYLIHANHWPLSKAYGFVLERRKGISPNIGFVSELMGFEEEELGGKSGGVSGAAWGGQKGYAKHHHRQGGAAAAALPQPSAPAATREENGGGKVEGNGDGATSNNPYGYGMIASTRKSGGARESMPPPATHIHHGYSQSVTEPSTSASFHLSDGGSGSGNNSASSSATASPELNGEYRTGASYLGGSGADARQGSSGPSFPPLSAGGILALGDAAQELEVRDANGRYRHARRAPVNETTLQPMRRVSKAGLESGEFFYGDGKMTWGDVEDEEVVEDSPAPVKEAGV